MDFTWRESISFDSFRDSSCVKTPEATLREVRHAGVHFPQAVSEETEQGLLPVSDDPSNSLNPASPVAKVLWHLIGELHILSKKAKRVLTVRDFGLLARFSLFARGLVKVAEPVHTMSRTSGAWLIHIALASDLTPWFVFCI